MLTMDTNAIRQSNLTMEQTEKVELKVKNYKMYRKDQFSPAVRAESRKQFVC